MGDPNGADDERPRRMKIERPFWLGKFEISNEQYRCFDPSHSSGVEPILGLKWGIGHFPSLDGSQQPVCRVSWQEATAFCRWLSTQTGKPFSLPTEAQWEWACRSGTNRALSFGDASSDYAAFANLADASYLWLCHSELMPPFPLADANVNDGQTVSAPVIFPSGPSRKPNAWGLYDMHGNAAEWTSSAYTPQASVGDRTGPGASDRRVVRGGSWADPARFARSARRASFNPWQRIYNVGFRVIIEIK
jgi:formylglycine-generating enzyme required for sulfatase activity